MRMVIIDPHFPEGPVIEQSVLGPVDFTLVRSNGAAVDPAVFAGADAVVNWRSRHPVTSAVVAGFDSVRILVQAGVGYDHIDLDACARRGIPVCNTPDYGTTEVADHALALILSLSRGVTTYAERLRTRDDAWQTAALPVPPVRRLRNRTLGIVGLGRIGLATAMRARAFGLRVIFHDPYLPPGAELGVGLERVATLPELLGNSDIVSLHCPLTAETRGMIDQTALAAIKDGAVLINTARGKVIDLDAVEAALRDGRLCAAGLDVLPTEPLDRSHPLIAAWIAREPWLEGRLDITPHAAFYSPESQADIRRLSSQAAADFLFAGKLRSCVNLRRLQAHGFFLDKAA